MKRNEPTWKERVKAALLRDRERIREERQKREFASIYSKAVCPICKGRSMSGIVCRMRRGTVCMKHCIECEHFAPIFWHCTYRETEPVDMRKWLLIYGCERRDELWKGIYQRELLQRALLTVPKPASLENQGKAASWADDVIAKRKHGPRRTGALSCDWQCGLRLPSVGGREHNGGCERMERIWPDHSIIH